MASFLQAVQKKRFLFFILFLLLCLNVLFTVGLSLSNSTNSFAETKVTPTQTTETLPELHDFTGKNLTFEDLSTYFNKLSDKKGAVYAYKVLQEAVLPPNTDMHLLGHVVGDALFGQQGAEGIVHCTQDFRNACSHSIVVGLFKKEGTKALDTITQVCKKAPGGKGAYTMCFHGLGHGVLAFVEYDMEKAVALCKRTGTEAYHNQEYTECVGGITMEMMSGVNDPDIWEIQKNKYFSVNDPLAPCSTDVIPQETKGICYTYLTPHLFEATQTDISNPTFESLQRTFALCNRLPKSDPNRNVCYGSFGKEFVTLAQNRDIRHIEDMTENQLEKAYMWCTAANDSDGIASCIRNAIQSLYWGGENKPDAAIKYCGIIQDQGQKNVCYEELFGAVSYYIDDRSYKQDLCNTITGSIKQQCQNRLL